MAKKKAKKKTRRKPKPTVSGAIQNLKEVLPREILMSIDRRKRRGVDETIAVLRAMHTVVNRMKSAEAELPGLVREIHRLNPEAVCASRGRPMTIR